jgi:hypothetical protein
VKPWFGPRRLGWGLGVRRWPGTVVIILFATALAVIVRSALEPTLKLGAAALLLIVLAVVVRATYGRDGAA